MIAHLHTSIQEISSNEEVYILNLRPTGQEALQYKIILFHGYLTIELIIY